MRIKVLRLYKDLMRYGQTLEFTDKHYYRFRVRKGFKQNQNLDDVEAIKFYIEKGQKALETRRVV